MLVQLLCPHCNAAIPIDDEILGEWYITCSSCGIALTIEFEGKKFPSPEELEEELEASEGGADEVTATS